MVFSVKTQIRVSIAILKDKQNNFNVHMYNDNSTALRNNRIVSLEVLTVYTVFKAL